MKRFSICIAAFSLFTVWGLHIPATHAGTMDLITTLVSSLGITKDQAMGGTGALFQNAEENLIGQDFQKVSDAVPGMDRYLAAAPARASGGGLGGALGSTLSSLGRGAGKAGSMMDLTRVWPWQSSWWESACLSGSAIP